MLKKFVPLNCNASPSKNPYEVRTYLGDNVRTPDWPTCDTCRRERVCKPPQNSTISKVLTIEDEIRRLHQKAKESRFARAYKKKCLLSDEYTMCVIPQRNPMELRLHAEMRERYLATRLAMQRRVHDAAEPLSDSSQGLVRFNSPLQVGEEEAEEEADAEGEEEGEEEEKKPVKVRLASPGCSMDLIFVPPSEMLELKRPKSGLFVNETEEPSIADKDIDYDAYNPRVLQEQFDAQGIKKIDVIEGKNEDDLWTWNIGVQRKEEELTKAIQEASVGPFDCQKLELILYTIPPDLDKTFEAEIVFGNEAVPPTIYKKKPFYYRPKEIACLFLAYVESYNLNPDFWRSETLDSISYAADKLLAKCASINYKAQDMEFDIISQIPDKKAHFGVKIHYTGVLRNEPNIYKTLSLYFSKYNAAILVTKSLYLLIFKRCMDSYFVYDPNGRDDNCHRDFENGKSSLISLKYIEHLVHLIVSYSDVGDLEDDFSLYGIFMINFGKITQPISLKPQPKLTHRLWAVVNNTYAIIPGANNGIQQPFSGAEQNASMLASLLGLLYSDIEIPTQWRMDTVDELIKFGQAYNKSFLKGLKLKKNQQTNIIDLPETVMMGAYKAKLKKRPFLYTGHVADCDSFRSFRDSQLMHALQQLFNGGKWEAALLQIDNSFLSVWRDNDYYYLFDPFRRGKAGQVLDPEDYLTKGVACLQMHTNFESFCRILHQKAIKMRRGGKFFVHGINVGCIKPMTTLYNLRNKYGKLNLTYPKHTNDLQKVEKPKKGAKKVRRAYSIQSIPDEERIPEYDDVEVVTTLLDQIICEIIEGLEEPMSRRPALYKKAKRVLLRSDREYLEQLRHKLKHNLDFDNLYTQFQTKPDLPRQPLTVEEELALPSNFEMLPDGAWVIFGTSQLPEVTEEVGKLSGLLAGLVTVVLTAKYKVSTWNSDLIEFALESVSSFGEEPNYEQSLKALVSKKIPKISIGHNTYQLDVAKVIKSQESHSLRQVLLENLCDYNRFMVICQRFSCVLIKRYSFLYMFIGFPCNSVGYRKFGSGPACILRFVELDALIRRIEFGCNPQGCEITNYVLVAFKVHDITSEPPVQYRPWGSTDEEIELTREKKLQKAAKERKLAKMRFLEDELRRENLRIQDFLKAKEERKRRKEERRRGRKAAARRPGPSYVDEDGFYDEEGAYEQPAEIFDEEEGEEEIELKHKPGKKLKKELPDKFKPRPIVYGYRMRNEDCLFKIQGSTALEGRDVANPKEIKACFFASTLAILYAILRPLNQWNKHRVNRVIEGGKAIASKVTNMTTSFERIIKHVTVDDYEFDVWAKTFEPPGAMNGSVKRKIMKAMSTRHYVLLQTANCTYTIFRDEYYHLFDPYGSMDKGQGDEEEEQEEDDENEGGEGEEAEGKKKKEEEKKKCPKGVKKWAERNMASWVLFADVDSLLKYIDERNPNAEWKESLEFQMHVVDVLSYKKAPANTRILQLLTDSSAEMRCKRSKHLEDESIICAHNETPGWLEMGKNMPIWSRLNRRNAAGRYRNMPVSKNKKFDIEIENRLWSLWGNLHPQAPVFPLSSRGKQYLACNVMACAAAKIYRLTDWSGQLLDNIVISGDKYHRDSMANIKQLDYEFSLEDLDIECTLENIKFEVHLEHVIYGKLYCIPSRTQLNLAESLMYFFSHFQFGILQCYKRSLAIGRTMGHDGGYFMFDCQSRDHPLFPKGQGAAYVLRTKNLQVLLYCIVVALNVSYFNVEFTIHKVELLREGASVEESEEGEEEEEEDDEEAEEEK